MARIAENGRVRVHVSELIEVSGDMNNGHELKIRLDLDQGRLLQDTFNVYDQMENPHLGHAFWHACNPVREFPCQSCQNGRR